MKIQLHRVNDTIHFEARNERGNRVQIDGAESMGGEGKGMRPMELLLVSVASCSAMDLVSILKKQRQKLDDIRIEVTGDRPGSRAPRPFRAMGIHFVLTGELNPGKVEHAVTLAVEKFCSAAETLSRDVHINHSYEIKLSEQ